MHINNNMWYENALAAIRPAMPGMAVALLINNKRVMRRGEEISINLPSSKVCLCLSFINSLIHASHIAITSQA